MEPERLFELINLRTFVAVYHDLLDHVENSAEVDAADASRILNDVMDEVAVTVYGFPAAADVVAAYEDGSLGD